MDRSLMLLLLTAAIVTYCAEAGLCCGKSKSRHNQLTKLAKSEDLTLPYGLRLTDEVPAASLAATYISLGKDCSLNDDGAERGRRQFRGCLRTDAFEDVINILACDSITDVMPIDAMSFSVSHLEQGIITFRSNQIELVCDGPLPCTQQEIDLIYETYQRRRDRLVQAIRNDSSIKYFLRFGPVSEAESKEFIKTVKAHNPRCRFLLVSWSHDVTEKQVVQRAHFLQLRKEHGQFVAWNEQPEDGQQIKTRQQKQNMLKSRKRRYRSPRFIDLHI